MTTETIKQNQHQLSLEDLDLIRINELSDGLADFSQSRINDHQMYMHWAFSKAIETGNNTKNYVSTMNYINEIFLFIGQNAEFAEKLKAATDRTDL